MKTSFRWNKPISQIMNEATGGERTLLFMASEAKRLMGPYVPAKNMGLSGNDVRVYVEDDSGIVHYLSPYAHYQHEGILMVSSRTGSAWARYGESKVYTDQQLSYGKLRHPMATSHWEKAMKAVRMGDYVAAVQAYIGGIEV